MTIQQLLDRKILLEQKLKEINSLLNQSGKISRNYGKGSGLAIVLYDGGNNHRNLHLTEELVPKIEELLAEFNNGFKAELKQIDDTLATMEKVLQGLTGGVQC